MLVVLILGGQDKGNDYNEIIDLVQEKVRAIVCMGIDNVPIHKAFESVIKKYSGYTQCNRCRKGSLCIGRKRRCSIVIAGMRQLRLV